MPPVAEAVQLTATIPLPGAAVAVTVVGVLIVPTLAVPRPLPVELK